MNVLISLGIWIFVGIATLAAYIAIIPHAILFGKRFDPQGRFGHNISFLWAKAIVSINPFWKFKITGIDNIKKDKNYIFLSNHQSMADIILLTLIKRQFKWVIKDSLFKIPVFGRCIRLAKYIELKRGKYSSIKEANEKVIYWLRQGISVFIFPEGTRSQDGSLGAFKNGAFKTAIHEKKPIVPIAILGSFDALPKGSWFFKRSVKGEVKILPSVDTNDYKMEDFAILRDLVRDKIQAALRG